MCASTADTHMVRCGLSGQYSYYGLKCLWTEQWMALDYFHFSREALLVFPCAPHTSETHSIIHSRWNIHVYFGTIFKGTRSPNSITLHTTETQKLNDKFNVSRFTQSPNCQNKKSKTTAFFFSMSRSADSQADILSSTVMHFCLNRT